MKTDQIIAHGLMLDRIVLDGEDRAADQQMQDFPYPATGDLPVAGNGGVLQAVWPSNEAGCPVQGPLARCATSFLFRCVEEEGMTRGKRSAALLWLAIVSLMLTACTEHKPVPPPEVKLNPAPKEVYEITITMEDAPASLEAFMGRVQYNIDNYLECVPIDYTRSLGGSRPHFERVLPIIFSRAIGNSFSGKLVQDKFLDENYYGLGECRWGITAIQAALDHPPPSRLMRLNIRDPETFLKGLPDKGYCLRPIHVRSELAWLCTGSEGMQSSQEPTEWYFKVMTEARRN